MVTIDIDDDRLVVAVRGFHKLLALKRRLVVPLAHVRGATADSGITIEPASVRAPGAYVPGVVTAGTYHKDGERSFWDVRDRTKAVVIELREHDYRRLVVEVRDPRATVDLIEGAMSRR